MDGNKQFLRLVRDGLGNTPAMMLLPVARFAAALGAAIVTGHCVHLLSGRMYTHGPATRKGLYLHERVKYKYLKARCYPTNTVDAGKKLIDTLRGGKEKSKKTYEELAAYANCNIDMIKNIFAGKISCGNFLVVCEVFRALGLSIDEFAEIPLRADTRTSIDSAAMAVMMDAIRDSSARTDAAHKATVCILQNSIAGYKTALEETRERAEARERKLHTRNTIMAVVMYALIAVIILFTVIDFLNPTVGWWRGRLSDAAASLRLRLRG